jgi:hypothetical protein
MFGLAWLVLVLFQLASKDIMTMYCNNQVTGFQQIIHMFQGQGSIERKRKTKENS